MTILCINVDHVATVREARKITEPDLVAAALICELAGAAGITLHVREDRRHAKERDLALLMQTAKTRVNLEMAATNEMVNIARKYHPHQVTLVPEKREEVTTEGGLDVARHIKKIGDITHKLQKSGIRVSLFIDPEEKQLIASAKTGAEFIELHTGRYCDARNETAVKKQLDALVRGAEKARELGLRVNAGHGLNYRNVKPVAAIEGIEELNIGHSVISHAIFVGLERAVKEMLALIREATSR
ncbi:pyridoxine 5'-phosphate synthase [Candidatus Sumerlaeota bacterium]|nr:pyridoxine 5'-phosphate synthase [Candidatus Sumerlaeota bacterium]